MTEGRESIAPQEAGRDIEPLAPQFDALFELESILRNLEKVQPNFFYIVAAEESDKIALSGRAKEKHIQDRSKVLKQEFEIKQAEIRGAAQQLLQSEEIKTKLQAVFGEEEPLDTLKATRDQAAELLEGFYKLYIEKFKEAEKQHEGELSVDGGKRLKASVAWDVAAIAVPQPEDRTSETSDWDSKKMEIHHQRRAQWDETIFKLNFLPGEHRKALAKYLKERNSESAFEIIESYKSLTNGKIPKRFQNLEMPYTVNERVGLETEMERIETLLKNFQEQRILGEITPAEAEKPKGITPDRAREIMGRENVIGKEEIQRVLEINVDQVPAIPYSEAELRSAKELGMTLVLRLNKDNQGRDLTGARLNEIFASKMPAGSRFLNSAHQADCWYKDEAFFTSEAPQKEWKLVSGNCIPNSTSQDYVSQTKTLRDALKAQGVLTSEEEQECTDARLTQLAAMARDNNTWQQAAEQLANLKVNFHRPNFSEGEYDTGMIFLAHNKRVLENMYTWTRSRASSGELVNFGDFDTDGMSVHYWEPINQGTGLGVSLSR